jgi:hypothetical protein
VGQDTHGLAWKHLRTLDNLRYSHFVRFAYGAAALALGAALFGTSTKGNKIDKGHGSYLNFFTPRSSKTTFHANFDPGAS